jgi:DNA-binding MarR family transcriptional regulator
MIQRDTRTEPGEAATDVVLRTFRANGLFLAAGDLLTGDEGLTSARWQVLGAVALAGRPLTVPQIARRMGLTRQSVQASVNRLLTDALVEAVENPDHRRSPLIRLTDLGSTKYAALERRQVKWINELAAGLDPSELSTAARVLQELTNRLETNARSGGRETQDDATP